MAFGVGKALSQPAGGRIDLRRQRSLFSSLVKKCQPAEVPWVPTEATGSCPSSWQLIVRLTGQPGALGKENYSQWGLSCCWLPLCCLSDILSISPPCLTGDTDPGILERLIQSTILSFYLQAYLYFHSEDCKIGLLCLANRAVQGNNSKSLLLFICITLSARDYDIHCYVPSKCSVRNSTYPCGSSKNV